MSDRLSHLERLEAESMHIIREVAAECRNPVMLYSIGKDSSVMLHLARKAFLPAPPPFPLMHIDTTWKFREMIEFRDRTAAAGVVDEAVDRARRVDERVDESAGAARVVEIGGEIVISAAEVGEIGEVGAEVVLAAEPLGGGAGGPRAARGAAA